MRLVIVRHGETEWNVAQVIQGHSQNSLSDHGRNQVFALAKRLQQESIDCIYSSDLQRARETADIVARHLKLPVNYSSKLRERAYGRFEGGPAGELSEAFAQSGLAREQFIPSGGESLLSLELRVAQFLTSIEAEHPNHTVLIIAHGGSNRALFKLLLQKGFDEWSSIPQDNCSVSIFDHQNGRGTRPILLNCTHHLSGLDLCNAQSYE